MSPALWPVLGFCRRTVKCKLVFPFTRMDNFSRLFAVFQSSTHKSVNLKGPFHSFIVNICQCSGAVIAVTGESRGPAMASQLHRFGNVKDYRPFHSGCGSQQVHIFWAVIPLPCSRPGAEQTRAPGRSAEPQPRLPPTALRRAAAPAPPGRRKRSRRRRRRRGEVARRVRGDPSPAAPHDPRPTSPPSPAPRWAPAGRGNASPLLCALFNFHAAF